MAKLAVKVLTRILAAGNKQRVDAQPVHHSRSMRAVRGFTLLELLIVVAIMATVVAGASLALPSGAERQLTQDGERLVTWLEIVRAQSRSAGVAVRMRLDDQGFAWNASGEVPQQRGWLHADTRAMPATLALGPEPVIGAQRVQLYGAAGQQLVVATDGVRPFAIQEQP